MPRAWLHRQTPKARTLPNELTIKRSENPTNNHPILKSCGASTVPMHRKRRLVSQRGKIRVTNTNVASIHQKYFGDWFTTTLDLPFVWIILIYSVVYLASWSGFGTLWWVIHRVRESRGYGENYCVENIHSWTTAFLFSIETQTTIGYGGRQVTSNCPEAVILLLLQTLVGSFIAATLLGIVFSKASRPKKRSKTILFSKKATIGKRDDRLCLMFRVANLRKSQLIECHLQTEIFYNRETSEGEIPYFHEPLTIGNGFNEGQDNYYTCLLLPSVIVHVIDECSPLYGMTKLEILSANVEVVVILEGVIENTGLTMQARTSYAANEIDWGSNFVTIPRKGSHAYKGQLMVDFNDFDEVECVSDMPMCSAKDYEKRKQSGSSTPNGTVVSNDAGNTKDTNSPSQPGSSTPVRTREKLPTMDEISDGCEVIPNGLVTTSHRLQEVTDEGLEMDEIC